MKSVLVIGDIMLDRYTFGKVRRISPEAPVPVLLHTEEKYSLGGAGNVARNLSSLGLKVYLCGVIGKDPEGELVQELLQERGIYFKGKISGTTIVKHRFIDIRSGSQLLRLDREQYIKTQLSQIPHDCSFDAVIISDYGKGTIKKVLVDKIRDLAPLVLVDPFPYNIELYKNVTVLTPNELEAREALCRKFRKLPVEEVGKKIYELCSCPVIITMGQNGCMLIQKKHEVIHIAAQEVEVVDVAGAGDTFIAVLCYGLLQGLDLEEAAIISTDAATVTVQKRGVATLTLEEVKEYFRGYF